jgi:hypothetical protein
MSIANGVNIVGLSRNKSEFNEFFKGFGNCLNSVLCFLTCFIMVVFPFYYHIRITMNQKRFLEKPKVMLEFENFLESLHCKHLFSSVYNIMFLYRRLMQALCLICWSDYPYFQVQALLQITLLTMWYIGYHRPFSER